MSNKRKPTAQVLNGASNNSFGKGRKDRKQWRSCKSIMTAGDIIYHHHENATSIGSSLIFACSLSEGSSTPSRRFIPPRIKTLIRSRLNPIFIRFSLTKTQEYLQLFSARKINHIAVLTVKRHVLPSTHKKAPSRTFLHS